MITKRKTTLWLAFFALTLTGVVGLNFSTTVSAGGDDLGTSPFDFTDAVYRAHGIVPENIVLRVGTPARAGDFVIDNTNTDPNRTNVRTIESTPGTTGSSGLTYANIFGVLNSTSFERNAAGQLTSARSSRFRHRRAFPRLHLSESVERLDSRSVSSKQTTRQPLRYARRLFLKRSARSVGRSVGCLHAKSFHSRRTQRTRSDCRDQRT